MSVELKPLGVRCNIQCQYCYQNPIRDAGNVPKSYDMDKIKKAIEAEGGPFNIFGGEALLVPKRDLENLWEWGLQRYGRNGIQTNGTLIDDDHLRMFKKYRVHVGISIDGPGPLNDARWNGTEAKTRAATEKTERAIERLCIAGIPPSLIITLHRANATNDKLPLMCDWVRSLDQMGVRWIRLHLLESESATIRAKYALSIEENIQALLRFAALERMLPHARFDLFLDMRNMLLGRDERATCIWTGCDPYTTSAVRGVEGNGQSSNCGRTNKEGVDFIKAEAPGFERYLALYATSQDVGGCHGCRFFLMCKGQCPGTSIDGDWRNRSEHCEIWKAVYEHLELELQVQGRTPLSLGSRRSELEQRFMQIWSDGKVPLMAKLLRPSDPQGAPSTRWREVFQDLKRELTRVAHESVV